MTHCHTVRLLTLGFMLLGMSAAFSSNSEAQIGIGISVRIGPPALPVYEQPIAPSSGYLWTPGYWAWDDDGGYYWVPGTWVLAPVGMLWTPGYWRWNNGAYAWNGGYWGPHIGYYGGINYGYGYGGVGFFGGEWRRGAFFYNTAVMNVNPSQITNVYVNRTVIVNNDSHAAFNGGPGGVVASPTPQEESYSHEPHQVPLAAQAEHERAASQNRVLYASENHGSPAVAATVKPGLFSGPGVVTSKAAGAPYHAPTTSPKDSRIISNPVGDLSATKKAEGATSHSFTPDNNSISSNSNRPETTNKREEKPANTNESHQANQPAPTNITHTPNQAHIAKVQSATKPHQGTPHSSPKPSHSAPKPQEHKSPPKHENESKEH